MPQLVKGGKHVFGWSRVGATGRIVVPPEAWDEYELKKDAKMILMPGSRTSGGFGLAAPVSLGRSPLAAVVDAPQGLQNFQVPEGTVVEFRGRPYAWVTLGDGSLFVPAPALAKFGIEVGNRLLVIRGSGRALGFAVRGPIVEEAARHPGLASFTE
jgi:bifunctional DNA-binding transcriptional regulator/antitoxin component of YhaV-PrlF toxin-antitoxin module